MGFIHGLLALGPSVGLSQWGIPFGDQRDGKAKVFIPLTFTLWSCLWLALQFSHSVVSDSLRPHGLSTPGFPVHHQLPDLAETHVHQVSDAIHLILCRPLLLLPSIFPTIRVFSNESALCIRWPKDWSFSFSISPSNEYPGLISFGMD